MWHGFNCYKEDLLITEGYLVAFLQRVLQLLWFSQHNVGWGRFCFLLYLSSSDCLLSFDVGRRSWSEIVSKMRLTLGDLSTFLAFWERHWSILVVSITFWRQAIKDVDCQIVFQGWETFRRRPYSEIDRFHLTQFNHRFSFFRLWLFSIRFCRQETAEDIAEYFQKKYAAPERCVHHWFMPWIFLRFPILSLSGIFRQEPLRNSSRPLIITDNTYLGFLNTRFLFPTCFSEIVILCATYSQVLSQFLTLCQWLRKTCVFGWKLGEQTQARCWTGTFRSLTEIAPNEGCF